ncbi:MAG: DNA-directed RNA polymerase subunit P [Candidatus Nanohaloarchaea archaeon]|nr:DNA-directed RNA polymerase subunit P [Candidatus Nanohaloarchaea archaeon]
MPYVCTKCEEEIDIDPIKDRIICPYCSGRAVLKTRPDEAKEVKAR